MNRVARDAKPHIRRQIAELTVIQLFRVYRDLAWSPGHSVPEDRRLLLQYAGRMRVQRAVAKAADGGRR